jgi:penicillin-binding protein 1C
LPSAACPHRCHGWFIPGISPIAACEVHREILIDAQTGLRLPLDDGSVPVARQVYEFWPSDLLALFEKAGLPRRRPPPFAPGSGVESIERTGKPPEIVSPAAGRIYAVQPGESSGGVALQARSEADVARIYWFAGKTFLGAAGPRESLAWQPAPGRYHILALDDHGRSSSSTVTLQSTETR